MSEDIAPAGPSAAGSLRRGTRWRRWIAGTVFVVLAIAGFGFATIHPFLAVTAPVPAKILVVEGWLPDYAIEEALAEYRRNGYERIYTTGGPLERGSYLSQHGSHAEVAAATLKELGASAGELRAIPSSEKYRNRTFASAVALREQWRAEGLRVDAINLVSQGTHARRSWLCFRRALGRHVEVGVISIENRDYDSNQWWRYSSGIKTILGETLALLYAWLSIDYGD